MTLIREPWVTVTFQQLLPLLQLTEMAENILLMHLKLRFYQHFKNYLNNLKGDNANHVYITRWYIGGKPRFVAVDEWIPGKGNTQFFSKPVEGKFWPTILEKSYAKIFGSFEKIESGYVMNFFYKLLRQGRLPQVSRTFFQGIIF